MITLLPGCTQSGTQPATKAGDIVSSARNDGYQIGDLTIQGVRAFDSSLSTWTTPDAYSGDIHDPATQHRYMWNGNNALVYEDPSGYDTVTANARDVWSWWPAAAGGPQHTFIEVTKDNGRKDDISFGPSSHATLQRQPQGYEADRRINASTLLASCKGTCTTANSGFSEKSMMQTANSIDTTNKPYGGVTENSNSAAAAVARAGGVVISGGFGGLWVPGLNQPGSAGAAPTQSSALKSSHASQKPN